MKWIGISHQLEPRPGGIFRVEISAGNIARGIYTQVIRPHRVAFTWGWETHAADLMALADLPPGASFGGDRSHTEGRRNSIAIPSQPPTESIVEIARRTVVYLSRPPQNRGFRPCSRRTARCNQHVARDLISGTQDQEERSAHENPQTNGHIQGLSSASVRHDHAFEEAPIPFWREGQNQPTCWGKIHRLGFSPFGHQFGPEARQKKLFKLGVLRAGGQITTRSQFSTSRRLKVVRNYSPKSAFPRIDTAVTTEGGSRPTGHR